MPEVGILGNFRFNLVKPHMHVLFIERSVGSITVYVERSSGWFDLAQI